MHTKFPNSGLLVTDGAGHCSLSVVNDCTLGHVRTYFQTGALPPPATLCVPPPSPFSLNSTDPTSPFYDPSLSPVKTGAVSSSEVEQQALHAAAVEVRRVVTESDVFGFGFGRVFGGGRARDMMRAAARAV